VPEALDVMVDVAVRLVGTTADGRGVAETAMVAPGDAVGVRVGAAATVGAAVSRRGMVGVTFGTPVAVAATAAGGLGGGLENASCPEACEQPATANKMTHSKA
jgi:hypothetical protein